MPISDIIATLTQVLQTLLPESAVSPFTDLLSCVTTLMQFVG